MNRSSQLRFFAWAIPVILALPLLVVWTRPARAGLPPRPEDLTPEPDQTEPAGAGISLSLTGAPQPMYAVVQWQDGLGDWHDIDAWRGAVEGSRALWFVAEKDFGCGPFRWLVYDDLDFEIASDPFDMPTAHKQLVQVQVTVP